MSRRRVVTPMVVTIGVIAGGTAIARLLGYKLGGNVVVRCRQGHVFTTLWIPGVKLKSVDLVVARCSTARSASTGASSSRCARPT